MSTKGRRFALAATVLAAAGYVAAPFGAQADPSGKNEQTGMVESPVGYPHFEEVAASPQQNAAGVNIRLGGGSAQNRYPVEQPIPLHGTYGATPAILETSGGEPLTTVFILITRVDATGAWIGTVIAPHSLPSVPADRGGEAGETGDFVDIGYFNLDLTGFADFPGGPGRYWVMAAMREHVSPRASFEIVEQADSD